MQQEFTYMHSNMLRQIGIRITEMLKKYLSAKQFDGSDKWRFE